MLERALCAIRFAVNATTKLRPFEAHHGREANTVLRNLTKKRSLQHLNWSRVIRQKISCLDDDDPTVPDLPHPADTNWDVRSDSVYDLKIGNHPRKPTEELQVEQRDKPWFRKLDTVNPQPGQLYQRTRDRNFKGIGK